MHVARKDSEVLASNGEDSTTADAERVEVTLLRCGLCCSSASCTCVAAVPAAKTEYISSLSVRKPLSRTYEAISSTFRRPGSVSGRSSSLVSWIVDVDTRQHGGCGSRKKAVHISYSDR